MWVPCAYCRQFCSDNSESYFLQVMNPSREAILTLYRNLIRESKKWNSYNYRMYALRKVRHEFKENKILEDKEKIKQFYAKGREALAMIKRQAILGNLYSTKPLVIETKSNTAVK